MAYGLGVVNVLHEAHFTVFQADGVTPLTGQAGGVTSSLVANGAGTAEAVAIAEIGVTGRYFASYTPLSQGTYDLRLTMPAVDGRVLGETMEVYDRDIGDLTRIVDVQTALIGLGYDAALAAFLAALNNLSIADVQTAMTAQGYTVARAALLDILQYVLEVAGENTRWSALVFTTINDCALMTSARITAYTDPTLTVELRKWDVTATYNPDGSMATYQMVEIP